MDNNITWPDSFCWLAAGPRLLFKKILFCCLRSSVQSSKNRETPTAIYNEHETISFSDVSNNPHEEYYIEQLETILRSNYEIAKYIAMEIINFLKSDDNPKTWIQMGKIIIGKTTYFPVKFVF